MSRYEAGWRDGYNGRELASRDLEYRAGYREGQADQVRNARILAGHF